MAKKPVNNKRNKTADGSNGSNTGAVLTRYVEQFEHLDKQDEALKEQKKSVNESRKSIAAEAKGEGFDVALIKRLVKDRKDADAAAEREQLYAQYAAAIQLDLFGELKEAA